MTPAPLHRPRLALVSAPIALALAGLLLEAADLFPLLRSAVHRSPASMPSSRVVDAREIRAGHPLLSIYVERQHLFDPETGLLTNPTQRGRDWERPISLSFFDGGRLDFAGEAGLRIHGGKSRTGSPVQSFRVYFRRAYGATQSAPGVLFDGRADPVDRFVLHNDLRADGLGRWWHLVNPLAYDIAREIGCLVPLTQPVRFFLNGEFQGVYVVTEHVREPYLRAHFGHEAFELADTAAQERLYRRIRRAPAPLTIAQVEALVDLENLTRWALSILFSATTDPFQGIMFRDDTRPDARWFWVNWDMDHSFMDLYRRARVPWEHDTFRTLLDERHVTSVILTRLLAEEPAYHRRFTRRLVDMLNHQLTPAFLTGRFEHYRRIAEAYGVPHREYLPVLRDFLTRRPATLRALMRRHLASGPAYRIDVSSPMGKALLIDGFEQPLPYTGWYPQGLEVRLEVPPDRTATFSHWLVNGRRVETPAPALWHRVGGKMAIEVVFRGPA